MNTRDVWNRHYHTDRSRQRYPDENLVRLLSLVQSNDAGKNVPASGAALDYGFGSGRHLSLLLDFGYSPVCGLEVSSVALEAARAIHPGFDLRLLQAEEIPDSLPHLPWPDGFFSVIICWGVLHYLDEVVQDRLLAEFRRMLVPEGALLGTLRSSRDTHFKQSEVADSQIRLYDEQEARSLLSRSFPHVEIGHMERTPLGRTQLRISHWFFLAKPEASLL